MQLNYHSHAPDQLHSLAARHLILLVSHIDWAGDAVSCLSAMHHCHVLCPGETYHCLSFQASLKVAGCGNVRARAQRWWVLWCRDMQLDSFPAQLLDVVITAEDSLLPIGSVTAVLDNMIVIQVCLHLQASAAGRALHPRPLSCRPGCCSSVAWSKSHPGSLWHGMKLDDGDAKGPAAVLSLVPHSCCDVVSHVPCHACFA